MGEKPNTNLVERSISIACKVPPDELESLVRATCDIPEVGSYILDYRTGLEGLGKAVAIIKSCDRQKQVIFDSRDRNSQPLEDTDYLSIASAAGADAAILFLPRNPQCRKRLIEEAQMAGLRPIVSPEPREDMQISNGLLETALEQAIQQGVRDFWLRGTPPDRVAKYTQGLRNLRLDKKDFEFFLARQFDKGGELLNAAAIALLCDTTYHLVVGRAVCKSLNPEYDGAVEEDSVHDPRKVTKDIAREFINGSS